MPCLLGDKSHDWLPIIFAQWCWNQTTGSLEEHWLEFLLSRRYVVLRRPYCLVAPPLLRKNRPMPAAISSWLVYLHAEALKFIGTNPVCLAGQLWRNPRPGWSCKARSTPTSRTRTTILTRASCESLTFYNSSGEVKSLLSYVTRNVRSKCLSSSNDPTVKSGLPRHRTKV
jgi:hypothetical protein